MAISWKTSLETFVPTSYSHLLNTVSVETPNGFRTFNLFQGDLCDSNAELLVVSTHANPLAGMDGMVMKSMEERLNVDFSTLRPLLLLRDAAGSYLVDSGGILGSCRVLLVRIPGANTIMRQGEEPIRVYKDILWTVFGSLAALEMDEEIPHLKSMALPLLGGMREYEIPNIMETLLHQALGWLKASRFMEKVDFYVFEEDHVTEWEDAMNRALGRRVVNLASNAALEGLQQELRAQIERSKGLDQDALQKILLPVEEYLKSDSVYFHSVAMAARQTVEHMVQNIRDMHELPCQKDLFHEIKLLYDKDIIAPWIVNHFHCLRILGNEGVHAKGSVLYRPKELQEADLMALLCSLLRVLMFWEEWSRSEGAIEASTPIK